MMLFFSVFYIMLEARITTTNNCERRHGMQQVYYTRNNIPLCSCELNEGGVISIFLFYVCMWVV